MSRLEAILSPLFCPNQKPAIVPTIAITPKLTPTPTPTAVTFELSVTFTAADVDPDADGDSEGEGEVVLEEEEFALAFPGPGRIVRREAGRRNPVLSAQHVWLPPLQHQLPSAQWFRDGVPFEDPPACSHTSVSKHPVPITCFSRTTYGIVTNSLRQTIRALPSRIRTIVSEIVIPG
jgi:hypothetical protein